MKKNKENVVIDFFGEKCNIFHNIRKSIVNLYPQELLDFSTYRKCSQIQNRQPKALIIDEDFVDFKDWIEIAKYENSIYPGIVSKFVLTSKKIDKELRDSYSQKGVQFIYYKGNSYDMENMASNIMASIDGEKRIKDRYVYASVEAPVKIRFPAKLEKFNENNLLIATDAILHDQEKFILYNPLLSQMKVGKENKVRSFVKSRDKSFQKFQTELRLVSSDEIIDYERELEKTEFLHMEDETKKKVITDILKKKLKEQLDDRTEIVSEYKKKNILTNKDIERVRVLVISKNHVACMKNDKNNDVVDVHNSHFFNEELYKKIKPDVVVMEYEEMELGQDDQAEQIRNGELVFSKLNKLALHRFKKKIHFVLTNSFFNDDDFQSCLNEGFYSTHLKASLSNELLGTILKNILPKIKKVNKNTNLTYLRLKDPVHIASEIEIKTEILKISEEAIIFCGKSKLPENQLLRVYNFNGISFNVTIIQDVKFHEKNGYHYQIGLINGLNEKEITYLRSFNISFKKEIGSKSA